jgi:hypothetical protein
LLEIATKYHLPENRLFKKSEMYIHIDLYYKCIRMYCMSTNATTGPSFRAQRSHILD